MKAFKILKDSQWAIYSVTALFVIVTILSYYFGTFSKSQEQLVNYLQGQLEGKSVFTVIIFIILNNVSSAALSSFLGFLVVLPVFSVLANAYTIGVISNSAVAKAGPLILFRLFPHGIFEIPAFIIANAMGIRSFIAIFQKRFRESYAEMLTVFIQIIIPLLIIAGIIEGIFYYLGAA